MSHHCQALILHCIDFRLGQPIKKYLGEQNLLGDIDMVSIAGAAKTFVEPDPPEEAAIVMKQIDISKSLHHIQEIILVNHTDCGAYGGHKAFGSYDEEVQRHHSDLQEAKKLVQTKYPDLEIKLVLADILNNGEVKFLE